MFADPLDDRFRGQSLPAAWGDAAADWLQSSEDEPAWLFFVGTDLSVSAPDAASAARTFVTQAATSRRAVVGDPARAVRTVELPPGPAPFVTFKFTAVDAAELEDAATRLAAIAEELAPTLSYAFVNVHPDFGYGLNYRGRVLDRPGLNMELVDQVVLDVHWHQVLGPRHLSQVSEHEHLRPLAGRRAALQVGELRDWLEWERGLAKGVSGMNAPPYDQPDSPPPLRLLVPAPLQPLLVDADAANAPARQRLVRQPANRPPTG